MELDRPPGCGATDEAAILVVDDDDINGRVAQLMLSKLGHRVEVAKTGRAAVEAWQRGHHAVIFMDVEMLDMDGFEAAHQIKTLSAGSSQPYIIAYTINPDRDACRAAGMDSYLRKPVTRAQLAEAVDQGLAAAATRPDAQDDCQTRAPHSGGGQPSHAGRHV